MPDPSPDAPPDRDDARWMRRAISLAARARGNTRPNPLVGAVIVRDGRVLGEGFHPRAGEPHAERHALAACTENPAGATMHVTLEPCNHTGRTGPCTEAVIAAGIARVVVAQRDPNPVAGGGVERLRAAGIEVVTGVCEDEARALNPAFNCFHERRRPLVTLKWAMSLDGCTSCDSGHSGWITSEAARQRVHQMRAASDAVLVGIATALEDGAKLSARGVELPPGPPLRRLVLDSQLRLPTGHPFVLESQGIATVVCADSADAARETRLAAAGVEVWRVPGVPGGGVDPVALMARLHGAGVQSLFVEGGRRVAGALLEAGLADRIAAFIGFKVIGSGPRALSALLAGNPITSMEHAWSLADARVESGTDWILVEGRLAR